MSQIMSRPPSLAFLGSYVPRRCGIATFTHDTRSAFLGNGGTGYAPVIAVENASDTQEYPAEVAIRLPRDDAKAYGAAAAHISRLGVDAVNLQHEYGLFGGEAGSHVLQFAAGLDIPLITTLHTVLKTPDAAQQRVMDALVNSSAQLIVMTDMARRLLEQNHPAARGKTIVLPHGIPDIDLPPPAFAKRALGLEARPTLLSFGLLSPSKGFDTMIDALPDIVREVPDLNYIMLGATHPELARRQGEAYRDTLRARAAALGVEDNISFVNRYAELDELCAYIAAADVYVTPYPNEAQVSSGTLAYSYGLGRPVVSTPYWHAAELLRDGRGLLVPFGDTRTLARSISSLMRSDALRAEISHRAYEDGLAMRWPAIGQRLRNIVADTVDRDRRLPVPPVMRAPIRHVAAGTPSSAGAATAGRRRAAATQSEAAS